MGERARLDLATLHAEQGRVGPALVLLDRIASEAPDSRYTPSALDRKARILEDEGRAAEALATYEKILLEHEGYVLMDRVRDRIRLLRDGVDPEAEGELP